jgi:hypothetical protein
MGSPLSSDSRQSSQSPREDLNGKKGVMKVVRQLPRFKEFVSEIGLVDYWKKFGWPNNDICRPVGDDDFVCDWFDITLVN